jgi:hypothetical protein
MPVTYFFFTGIVVGVGNISSVMIGSLENLQRPDVILLTFWRLSSRTLT